MAFRVAKGGLLGDKRPPFRDQKTAFCNTIRNTLIIKRLQSSQQVTANLTAKPHNPITV